MIVYCNGHQERNSFLFEFWFFYRPFSLFHFCVHSWHADRWIVTWWIPATRMHHYLASITGIKMQQISRNLDFFSGSWCICCVISAVNNLPKVHHPKTLLWACFFTTENPICCVISKFCNPIETTIFLFLQLQGVSFCTEALHSKFHTYTFRLIDCSRYFVCHFVSRKVLCDCTVLRYQRLSWSSLAGLILCCNCRNL